MVIRNHFKNHFKGSVATMLASCSIVLPLLLATAGCALAAHDPAPDSSGAFITTLGRDTVVVESFTRTDDKLEGNIVVRVPGTVLLHYVVDLTDNGFPSHSVVDVVPMGTSQVASKRVTIDYMRDSVAVDVDSAGHHSKRHGVLEQRPYPQLMTGFGSSYGLYASPVLYELYAPLANAAVGDTVRLTTMDIARGRALKRIFVKRSASELDADYFGIGVTRLTLDANGRITAGDASETTEQTQMTRSAFTDLSPIAKRFAAMDKAGKGLGIASPEVVARATLDGAPVVVTYSSPRRRDRVLLGNVIPYGSVWRTGANSATTLSFTSDLDIGGKRIPAGVYSLWTLPKSHGSVELIVNSQHGQWGTDYDASHDVAHIPMIVTTATSPPENFAITVTDGDPGSLRVSWGSFIWSVPVSVVK
jgi:hypothetical protein